MHREEDSKGILRGFAAYLILGLGLIATSIFASTTLAQSAFADSAPKAIIIGTFKLCNLPAPTTTTTTITTGSTTPIPTPLPPIEFVLLPPPMVADLTQRGHIVATTGVRVYFPPGYQTMSHPEGPSGYAARYVLRAPSGTYLLRGFVVRRVTLVAGHTLRINVRRGDCS